MIRSLIAAVLSFVATTAYSGMACPIVTIYDVGSPQWLSNAEVLDGLQSQQSWAGISTTPNEKGDLIRHVAPGSAAEAAGLLVDDILILVNGGTDLSFAGIAPGELVQLQVLRGIAVLPLSMTMGRADPVHFSFSRALEADTNGCPNAKLAKAESLLSEIVLANVFNADRGFLCSSADEALSFMGRQSDIHEAYLIRGSRRILLVTPHFGSACIPASDLDGPSLTPSASRAFLLEAVQALFDYQLANP